MVVSKAHWSTSTWWSPKLVGQPVHGDLRSWLANQPVLVFDAGWPMSFGDHHTLVDQPAVETWRSAGL